MRSADIAALCSATALLLLVCWWHGGWTGHVVPTAQTHMPGSPYSSMLPPPPSLAEAAEGTPAVVPPRTEGQEGHESLAPLPSENLDPASAGRPDLKTLEVLAYAAAAEATRNISTAETWLPSIARQALLDRVAVAYIGGKGRAAHVTAAALTWLQRFPRTLLVTDVDPQDESVPDSLRTRTLNRFAGLGATDAEVAQRLFPAGDTFWNEFKRLPNGAVVAAKRPNSKGWDLGWYLAQSKYLAGLAAAVERYPDSDWFLLADSDAFVFADRLAQGVLAAANPEVPLALGSYWIFPPSMEHRTQRDPRTTNGLLLGGAGVLLSRGAVRQLNLSACLAAEVTQSTMPSDWRVATCLRAHGVPLVDVGGMQQINLEGGCNPQASAKCRYTLFFSIYPTVTVCPYTVHYVRPEQMYTMQGTIHRAGPSDLCLPDVSDMSRCRCSLGVGENSPAHGAWTPDGRPRRVH
jgi:hypothetical protein